MLRPASSCVFSAVFTILLLGCGPQLRPPEVSTGLIESERQRHKEQTLRVYFERLEKVSRVTSRLAVQGAELCGDQTEPLLGVFWADHKTVPEELADVAKTVYGLGDELRVLSVFPGLPGERNGLKPGDAILKINDADLRSASPVFELTSSTARAREAIRAAAGEDRIMLQLRRAGEIFELGVEPVPACSFAVTVRNSTLVNASTDGRNIVMNAGMVRFAQDEDELSIILGHELAHNILGHVAKSKGAVMVGSFLGMVLDVAAAAGGVNTGGVFANLGGQAGRLMFSKDYESEADYLGMYLAAKAGFNVSKAPDFWLRMAAEHPASIKDNFLSTHPSSPERAATLQATVSEIREKQKSSLPLVPARGEVAHASEIKPSDREASE